MAITIKNRADMVSELTRELCNTLRESKHDYQPMEVVNAALQFAQQSMRYVIRHSDDHESRLLNQGVMLQALDALKLDTVTESDARMVH
jgi:chemotaxis regulatin CheY-phosphate phosphatase CheZ